MTSTPDARLVEAHDLARAALAEITPPETIGDAVDYAVEEDGVVSLRFANRMRGYPGWFWTVSVAAADDDAEPTVLETELLPGEGALVAPDWVPWATRLADYHAAQAVLAEAAAGDVTADDEDETDEEGLDDDEEDGDLDDDEEDGDLDDEDDGVEDDDLEEAASARLHAGDVDGVDIDELDPDDDIDGDDVVDADPDDGVDATDDSDRSGR